VRKRRGLDVKQKMRANRCVFCVGGSLGWKVRGSLIKEFEDAAYELDPSTTSNPKWAEVKTKEGYHILMVEGRK
jgi:parvulin-like peptidyl-prolyl isomerase